MVVLLYALRYYWRATRGYRLRPWRSPYLAWRLETYFGLDAHQLTRPEFLRLFWQHRHRIGAFLRWAHDLERSISNP